MTPGFQARVLSELKQLLSEESYKKKLAVKNMKLRQPPVQPNYVAWLGGAIYGMLETLSEYSVTREKYKEDPVLPDWASILSYANNQSEKSVGSLRPKFSSYRKPISSLKVEKP